MNADSRFMKIDKIHISPTKQRSETLIAFGFFYIKMCDPQYRT